jgi:hypothetical protein
MTQNQTIVVQPFEIKDSALIALATGKRTQNLQELREQLIDIESDSLYYHFWGGLLRHPFDEPEYHNDFAIWCANYLHDMVLAERLSVIDPKDFESLEDLRSEIIEIVDERLDEIDYPLYVRRDYRFEFIRSQIVIFNTGQKIQQPAELRKVLPRLSLGTIFYHFIDANRRTPQRIDDFRSWLSGFGDRYQDLIAQIAEIDPYFSSLFTLRDTLSAIFDKYFKRGKT